MLVNKHSVARLVFCLSLTLGVCSFANAGIITGFTGVYAPGNWTLSQNGGDGGVNSVGAPGSIAITSSNNGSGNTTNTDFTVAASLGGTVTFDWSFVTGDTAISDPFGYLIDTVFTQLTNDNAGTSQNGIASFPVSQGQIFGFRAFTIDNQVGSATTTIDKFSAPGASSPPNPNGAVPEPHSIAIWGLVGLMGVVARKRAARKNIASIA